MPLSHAELRSLGLDPADRSLSTMIEEAWGVFENTIRGYSDKRMSPLDPCANAYEFVQRHGFKFDGRAYDWDQYSHLVECYQDAHPVQTYMAGAQSGKSVRIMTEVARQAILHWGQIIGYYFPDYFLPRAFSKERFRPFVTSSPELAPWLGMETQKGAGSDAVLTRSLGPTAIYFLSIMGKTATEGLPMPAIFLDEVRRMSSGDVQRATKRTSSYREPVIFKVSTARYPESDIHAAFLSGDQRYFHSSCGCAEGIVLALRWPDCVIDLVTSSPAIRDKVAHAFQHAGLPYLAMSDEERHRYGEAAYWCPDCGTIITNPRDGWWEQHNPQAYAHSYHMPQLLTMPAARVWQEFARPSEPLDIVEFHNSTLGLPFIDDTKRLVRPEHLSACIRSDIEWGERLGRNWRRTNYRNLAMGVDQMGRFNCVVIKQRQPNGKYRTVHLEVTHGDDTWKRCYKLMVDYDVMCAVVDRNPNFNDSFAFAKAFPGRVWLTTYESDKKGKRAMIDWKDRRKPPKGQKAKDTRWKFDVFLNLVTSMGWSTGRWARRDNEVPNPRTLIQELPKQNGKVMLSTDMRVGVWEPTAICEEVYLPHQLRLVRNREVSSDTAERRRDFRMVIEYVGSEDPHFAFANLFADVACSRLSNRRGSDAQEGEDDGEPDGAQDA